ncbi:MAG: geranylgeranylglyceryl/heptaprenylglyceryl phosphate synthase [Candidatus Bathyarchaeia archaeon]
MTVKLGKVEKYLIKRIDEEGALHVPLIDPENVSPERAAEISVIAEKMGSAAIMVGGSTVASTSKLNDVIKLIREKISIPTILFPNNLSGISPYADAIWFMSLLNSLNPYYIIGAQVLGASAVKEYGLEPLPLAYLIIGDGGAAGYIGQAHPIPYDKPEIAALYALAAQYLGMRFVYLEAGSGAKNPVPVEMVALVRKTISIPIIVGGGLRHPDAVEERVYAGADIIVTGTVVETSMDVESSLRLFVDSVKRGFKRRCERQM